MLLLAPAALPAGAVVEIGLVAIGNDGQPLDEGRVVLRSSYLRPHPLGVKDHIARYLVRVPPQLDAGPLRLYARLRQPDEQAAATDAPTAPDDKAAPDLLEATLPLCAGPLAKLTLAAPQPSRLHITGGDLWGHRVPVEKVEVFVNGRPARMTAAGSDQATLVLENVPSRGKTVEIEAVLDGVYARYALPGAGDSTRAGASAEPAADARTTAAPSARARGSSLAMALGVPWVQGPGYGWAAHVDADTGLAAWPASWRTGLGLGYLGTRTGANDDIGQSRIALDHFVLLARLRWQRQLSARIVGSLAGGAGLAYTNVRSEAENTRLADWRLGPAAEFGAEAAGPAGPGALALGLRYLYVPVGTLPGGNVMDGGGGGLVFDLGYRLRF